jgi:Ca2+-binding RTX toxin-like protein
MAKNCGKSGRGAAWQSGGAGDDRLVGHSGRDQLYGRGGDDHLKGGGARDWLHGGRGNDRLSGESGNDWLSGAQGNDRLVGGAGKDWLFGAHGNDRLVGGAGNDRAYGGHGNDVFVYRSGNGNDYFDGARGTDTIRLDAVAPGWTLHLRRGEVVADQGDLLRLSANAAGVIKFADGSTLRFDGVERIKTVPAETNQGEPDPAPLPPLEPNQAPVIVELSANAVVENAAAGTVVGVVSATDPDAGDALTYALVDDAGGRFTIDPASGAITVADGALLDWETADQHSVSVQVTDAHGLSVTATFAIAVQFDNSGNDTLSGSAADDVMDGGSGDDALDGGDGNDVLNGGDGVDFLSGGSGADQVSGGAGGDMLFGDDGDDWLIGGDGADSLHGGLDNDRMDGGAGDDRLLGNTGDDVLNGDDGDDRLSGSLGDDVLQGGAGSDSLSGGAGADRFVFDALGAGIDVIDDFGTGDVLAVGNLLNGFVAGQEADFVRLVVTGSNTTLEVDADGAANGSLYAPVVALTGVSGTTLTDLMSGGQIDFLIA